MDGWGRRAVGAALLVGVLAAGGANGARAADEAADAFEQGLDRIYALAGRGRFVDGRKNLDRLLSAHAGTPHARARRAELVDLVERLAFGAAHPAPRPQDVVSGTIEKYDPTTGYLRIVYTPATAADLRTGTDGLLSLPGRLRGPFLLEVWARRRPGRGLPDPLVGFGGDLDERTQRPQTWFVDYSISDSGARGGGTVAEVWIHHRDGAQRRRLAGGVETFTAGDRCHVQLKVTEDQIHAGLSDKTVASARKPPGMYGYAVFQLPGWERLVFTGTVEPYWIQSLVDARAHRQRAEFRAGFDARAHLPAWLFEAGAPDPGARPLAELPDAVPGAQVATLLEFRRALSREDADAARNHLGALRAAGAPAPVCDLLEAQVCRVTREHAAGLARAEACLAAHPEFPRGLLLKAEFLLGLDRGDEALPVLRQVLAQGLAGAEPYEEAALTLLQAGRPAEAAEVTREAAARGLGSDTLDQLGLAIAKARRGPLWSRTFELKSAHYHIVTDIDKNTCVRAARALEEALTCYRVRFRWAKHRPGVKYRVYIFSGQEGFLDYIGDAQGLLGTPHENLAGLYSPALRQLLVWNQEQLEAMQETLRHEGFHQYLDLVTQDAPVWLNEGLAVYFQRAERQRGALAFGAVRAEDLGLLRQVGRVPLSTFLFEGASAFYGRGRPSYAQAWALVHLFEHGAVPWRRLFDQVIADLEQEPAHVVLRRHFPPERVAELEAALRSHHGL